MQRRWCVVWYIRELRIVLKTLGEHGWHSLATCCHSINKYSHHGVLIDLVFDKAFGWACAPLSHVKTYSTKYQLFIHLVKELSIIKTFQTDPWASPNLMMIFQVVMRSKTRRFDAMVTKAMGCYGWGTVKKGSRRFHCPSIVGVRESGWIKKGPVPGRRGGPAVPRLK